MAVRTDREMKLLESLLEQESPGHPWIPLFILALRTNFYYISSARHGHTSNWHVVLPSMKIWKILEKRLQMELFTPENASDENHIVHKILLSNIGHFKVIDGKTTFVSVLQDSDNRNVLFNVEITKGSNGTTDYKIDGVAADRYQDHRDNNVIVHFFSLRGILGRKTDIDQIRK